MSNDMRSLLSDFVDAWERYGDAESNHDTQLAWSDLGDTAARARIALHDACVSRKVGAA